MSNGARTNFAKQFWNAAYLERLDLEHWHRTPPDAALSRLLAGDLRLGRILDLGCGRGAESHWLAQRGFSVVGAELSLAALAQGRTGGSWRPILGSAFELPFADACFDLVLDAGCLHTIGRGSRALYAREVLRVTRPGARVLVRGARHDDEEEGVVGVDADECRRWLAPAYRVVWSMPIDLAADSGTLPGVGVLLRWNGRSGPA